MTEIAEMMESNLLKLDALAKYQSWMHREEHLDHDSHQSNLKFFEQQWKESNRDPENDGLCQLPSFMKQDTSLTLWSCDGPDLVEAIADAAVHRGKYFEDAQYVLFRCHHHWHPVDPKTGERHPIRGCLAKGTKNEPKPSCL